MPIFFNWLTYAMIVKNGWTALIMWYLFPLIFIIGLIVLMVGIFKKKEKESYQPYVRVVTSDFKWSPNKNQLANNDQGLLNVTEMKNSRPQGFENVSLGVSGFEWFSNGKEFIVSSQSNLLPTGWSPIPLYRIPVDANLAKEKTKPFYTIQTKEPDLFGIDADYFKWSSDGKWVSFLVVPTASWSMDSNTLCVLSSQGKTLSGSRENVRV